MSASAWKQFVEVAVPLPLDTTFTYGWPAGCRRPADVGIRVLVPFGKRIVSGYVVGFPAAAPAQEIKPVLAVLDEEPLFAARDLAFFRWAAAYYCYPLGLTIKTALPQGLNVRYGYAAGLTPAGRARLSSDGPPAGRPQAVLLMLAEHGVTPVKKIQQRLGGRSCLPIVRGLARQGLVHLELQQQGARVRVRTETWYAPAPHPGMQPRGKQADILRWIAERETVPAGALKAQFGACASQVRSLLKKNLITAEEREAYRRPPVQETVFSEPVHRLNPAQEDILAALREPLRQRRFYPLLLHGITGSGKTEVYLQIMRQALDAGGQCLYLVPEIALTAQLWDRISSRLPEPIAMLHSGLTPAERYDAWRMIRRGEIRIVLGARSAVFACLPQPAAIIVDEEHDPSYKQDESLRYNARDLAVVKARQAGCIVVLGSATPSLESYHNSRQGKYHLGVLPARAAARALPAVSIVDLKTDPDVCRKKGSVISRPLRRALEQRLAGGQQSILFLNRRGFSPAYVCRQCGHAFRCRNCEVSLSHHLGRRALTCHYCDYSCPVPQQCPVCGSYLLASLGWGTERLEREIAQQFPGVRIGRMDRDTTMQRGALHALLARVKRQEIDILIGTQMIAKGYHLPSVTLVGVVCADQSLQFPDYRAGERTFQLLTQVAGRAGRGEVAGEVIVQTYNPGHYSIALACAHDYRGFYRTEIACRRELGFPPFVKMAAVRFEGPSKQAVEACARRAGIAARALLSSAAAGQGFDILGPAASPREKVQGRYRYQLMIKSPGAQELRSLIGRLQRHSASDPASGQVAMSVDVDPLVVL